MVHLLAHMIISSYKALVLCVVQLVVQGTLSLLDAATHAIDAAVHEAAQTLHKIFDAVLQTADGVKDIFVDAANSVLGLFGQQKIATHAWSEPAALRYVRPAHTGYSITYPCRKASLIHLKK